MALRRAELEKSCAILGVTHLEVLGFRDSGMAGWESNDHPAAFSRQDPSEAARPLASLMQLYRPQVVVTYDDFGFYGHPDHIQAHFVTVAALDLSGLQAKLYCPTVRRSLLGEFARRLTEAGIEPPTFDSENFGSPDEDVVATVDCEAYAEAKRRALAAHSSQTDNSFFLELPEDVFVDTFATEEFIRLRDPVSSPPPESDLFAGYRGACGEGTPD
jgi:LmbE family N-acetylglucosaminyl deacetylase